MKTNLKVITAIGAVMLAVVYFAMPPRGAVTCRKILGTGLTEISMNDFANSSLAYEKIADRDMRALKERHQKLPGSHEISGGFSYRVESERFAQNHAKYLRAVIEIDGKGNFLLSRMWQIRGDLISEISADDLDYFLPSIARAIERCQ